MVEAIREYATHDRALWPPGPWDEEHQDKVQWIDQETDLDCLAVRNGSGAWCGYVGVGPEHPLHGVGYSNSVCGHPGCYRHTPEGLLGVHGGITYSDFCQEGAPEDAGICHIPQDGRPDPVWWFGFDTAHAGDRYPVGHMDFGRDQYRTLAYVQEQCADLAKQLKEFHYE